MTDTPEQTVAAGPALKEAVERVTARLRTSIGVIDPRGSRTPIYTNPDGPEAAELIQRQTATLEALALALDRLLTIARSDADFQGAHPARDAAIYTASKALNQYRKGDL